MLCRNQMWRSCGKTHCHVQEKGGAHESNIYSPLANCAEMILPKTVPLEMVPLANRPVLSPSASIPIHLPRLDFVWRPGRSHSGPVGSLTISVGSPTRTLEIVHANVKIPNNIDTRGYVRATESEAQIGATDAAQRGSQNEAKQNEQA